MDGCLIRFLFYFIFLEKEIPEFFFQRALKTLNVASLGTDTLFIVAVNL